MYFPFLRGRQYELIALRELVSKNLLSDKILPIIEPIKPLPTLQSTLKTFIDNERKLAYIRTPRVGNFVEESGKEKNSNVYNTIKDALDSKFILSAMIYDEVKKNYIASYHKEYNVPYSQMLPICLSEDRLDDLIFDLGDESPAYIVGADSAKFRRCDVKNRVMLYDRFKKLNRNTDYIDTVDEFFSNDHLYYQDDHYAGFSDYSIVGKDYSESGFAPYAVAIHIVYLDDKNYLRIHHFVSDSNNDISDPAGKFYEALKKLIEWNNEKQLNTEGMRQFEEMYRAQTYSGLGVVKKLSIMHHLEVIGKYLDGVEK